MLGIIVPGELAVLVAGAGADRVAPDWIPTWALFVSATFFAGVAVWVYLWGARADRKRAKDSAGEVKTAIREAFDARDVQISSLREAVAGLPQKPLQGGHTYAPLPDGTNVVTMADGTIRLALPVRISGIGTTQVGGSASLGPPADTDDERPQ